MGVNGNKISEKDVWLLGERKEQNDIKNSP